MESPNFHTRPRITPLISNPIEHLPWIHDFTGHRGGRDGQRSRQVNVRVHAAFAALEIARGRSDADLAVGQESDTRLAYAATGRDDLYAGLQQRFDQSGPHALQVDLLRRRGNEETHALGHLAPFQHARGDFDVLETAVGAGADLRLVDLLAGHFVHIADIAELVRPCDDERHL